MSPKKTRSALERPLYEPVTRAIVEGWVETRGYDNFVHEETHSQGSRATGGTFSRPDVTVVGIRKFLYLPQRDFEVVTFEIKASNQLTVLGVLEALAHREASHRSFAIYQSTAAEFDQGPERDRIETLAEKFGVGVYVAEKPEDFSSWSSRVEAVRAEPDPQKLNEFIAGLRNEKNKNAILQWFR
jgi:hypothetical protein